ncbi:MAG: 30S ribosomal protein S5 [Candidatus Thermoplasmatota archaeon]
MANKRNKGRSTVKWEPKTKLGRKVRNGEIKSMEEALKSGLPLKEPEITDILIPEIDDEVIDVNMVQRMTDSGRRVKFVITVAVGNHDGYIGLAQAKGKEVGSSIRKAIKNAKTKMIEIRRGCGSWECGCGKPHTFPFTVKGKSGSVEITFKPAPRGVGLAVGDIAKQILSLAGIEDCWAFTRGKTRTSVNYAKAVYNSMKKNAMMRITKQQKNKIGIISGNAEPESDEEMEKYGMQKNPEQEA